MIYERAYDNIRLTISTARSIKKSQLVRFFQNQCSEKQIDYYLENLSNSNFIKYDPKSDIISWVGGVPVKDDILRPRRTAFWTIAAIGSENIREFCVRGFPSQFLFITTENNVYDVTVVNSKPIAMLARMEWNRSLICNGNEKGEHGDLVNHIALIPKEYVKDLDFFNLEEYGFDTYCVLDSDNMPMYTAI